MRRMSTMTTMAVASAVVTLGMGLSGCHTENPTDPADPVDPDDPGFVRSEMERELSPDVQMEQMDQLAADGRAFGIDLYHQLTEVHDGNLFCSPYSISTALAMTYAGARGDTERQMAEAMHFSLSQEDLHPAFNWLDLELSSRAESAPEDSAQPFTLNLVNSVWSQQDYPFESSYLDLLALHYAAGMHVVDFGAEPEACRQEINGWTRENTEGRIEELIEPGLITDLTKLVLVNAIYFNAAWSHQFEESATRDGTFHTLDGEVIVPMMRQTESFRYAEGDGYQALEMPYEGHELSMVILLPEEGQLEAFESALDVDRFDDLLVQITNASHHLTIVTMPRFSYRTPTHLNDALEALGMTDAFGRGQANFTGIANRAMWISHVVHEAFIDVDEEGTEAAAATAVIVDGDGDGDPDYMSFNVDRPFIFLIRDIPTHAVLFLGRVTDPS